MKKPAPFSALYLPPRLPTEASKEKTVLIEWTVESDPQFPEADPSANFSASTGEYVIPMDGLYTIVAQVIPINGAPIASAASRRKKVDYALRLATTEENCADEVGEVGEVSATFHDIGCTNFGEMIHLKQGTRIACLKMPEAIGRDSVRLKVELVQRKRKRNKPQLTRKQVKKHRNQSRKRSGASCSSTVTSLSATCTFKHSSCPVVSASLRDGVYGYRNVRNSYRSGVMNNLVDYNASGSGNADVDADENDDDDDDDDSSSGSDSSDWESGFESDSTFDQLPHSDRGVRRLAKRFKTTSTCPTPTNSTSP